MRSAALIQDEAATTLLCVRARALTSGCSSLWRGAQGYLRSLGEIVGPPPTHRSWHDEWVELNVEAFRRTPGRERFANAAHVQRNETIDRLKSNFKATIDGQVESLERMPFATMDTLIRHSLGCTGGEPRLGARASRGVLPARLGRQRDQRSAA